jgi:hypothetical protein
MLGYSTSGRRRWFLVVVGFLISVNVLLVVTLSMVGSAHRRPERPERAGKETPKVVLTLASVSTDRLDSGDILFTCKVIIENNTGAVLKVKSNFFSAFDGLSLVVRDEDGKELKKQSYTFHQSPFSIEPREYPLPSGKATKQIVFPVRGLPKEYARLKAQLIGTLPGSGYAPKLSSEILSVRPKKQ